MELEPEGGFVRERLVSHRIPRAEEVRTGRKVERFPVELEDRKLRWKRCKDSFHGRFFPDPAPAGLLDERVDPGAERGSDQLGAKADAKDRPALSHCLPDQCLFFFEIRQFMFIVHAHRPAHEHKMGGIGCRHFASLIKPEIFERDTVLSKDRFEIPCRFRCCVLEYGDLHAVS